MLWQIDPVSALMAGILGTLIMTIVMYALPLIGLPPMDIMAALGSVFPFGFSPYLLGSLTHLGIGIALALIYAALFFRWLPGPNWLRGALFSLLPWLFAITLLGPSLQLAAGIFGASSASTANPCAIQNPCAPKAPANPCAPAAAQAAAIPPQVLSLIVHLIYGAVVGLLYRPRT